jgi:hypothetical protein
MNFKPEDFQPIAKIEGYGGYKGVSLGVNCLVAGIETTEEEQDI